MKWAPLTIVCTLVFIIIASAILSIAAIAIPVSAGVYVKSEYPYKCDNRYSAEACLGSCGCAYIYDVNRCIKANHVSDAVGLNVTSNGPCEQDPTALIAVCSIAGGLLLVGLLIVCGWCTCVYMRRRNGVETISG